MNRPQSIHERRAGAPGAARAQSRWRRLAAFVLGTALLGAGPAAAEDWNQFRGPVGSGVATGAALADAWPSEGPPEVFRRSIGPGFSGIAIVCEGACDGPGDRLYTMDADEEHERLLALDAGTGATLWALPVGPRFPSEFGDGPRATPTVVGDRIVAASASLQLLVATPRGEVRWQRDLAALFGAVQPRFGYAPSPVVLGRRVILEVGGGEGEGIAAFDLESGEVLWTALDGGAGSSTPILSALGGTSQLIFHRRPEVVALSPEGELLWRHPSAPDAIVMPLEVPGDRVFVSAAAMGKGGVMLAVERGADGWEVSEQWVQRRMRNHFNTSVVVGGVLYGFDNATLRAVDAASGDLLWAARGFGKGSLVSGDGLLFVLGDSGTLALVEATPEAYVPRGEVQAMEGRSWTSPSLAGSLLVVRDHDELVAYDVGAEGLDTASAELGEARSDDRPTVPDRLELADVVARYEEARGGRASWDGVERIRLEGTWTTFSQPAPFVWWKKRGEPDRYRLHHKMLGYDFDRGRDADGLWLRSMMLGVEEAGPPPMPELVPQLEAEAHFEPALMGWREKGLEVELLGAGEIDGKPTIDLRIVRTGDADVDFRTEVWHLDPATGLEVAVDSTVLDPTQGPMPFARRTWFSEFRRVGDLVIPHRIASEFGARLEEIEVDEVRLDAPVPDGALDRPAPVEGAEDGG